LKRCAFDYLGYRRTEYDEPEGIGRRRYQYAYFLAPSKSTLQDICEVDKDSSSDWLRRNSPFDGNPFLVRFPKGPIGTGRNLDLNGTGFIRIGGFKTQGWSEDNAIA
jgi:hypothetical protein